MTELTIGGGKIKYYVGSTVFTAIMSTARKVPWKLHLERCRNKGKGSKAIPNDLVRIGTLASKVAFNSRINIYKRKARETERLIPNNSKTLVTLLDKMGKTNNTNGSAKKGGKPSGERTPTEVNNNGKHLTTPPENAEKKMRTEDEIENELLNPTGGADNGMEIDESLSDGNPKKPISWEINIAGNSSPSVTASREYVELERRLTAERAAKAQAEIRESDLRRQVMKMQETLDALLSSNTQNPITPENNGNETSATFVNNITDTLTTQHEGVVDNLDDDAIWQLPMESDVEQLMVIHFRNYPERIFNNEEFVSLQRSLSEAHLKAKGGSLNFRIIIDDLALKQGVAVARCRNVGTIIWISHMTPRLNEDLLCVKSNRTKLAPAFKIWASGADLTFENIKEGIMDHEIDSSGWKLIKVREPNPRAKVQGVDALFLGDENLKKLVRGYESRQCLVQFRLGGLKARIQSLIGINETPDGLNGNKERNLIYNSDNSSLQFKINKKREPSRWHKNRTEWKKLMTASCNLLLLEHVRTRDPRGSSPIVQKTLNYFETNFHKYPVTSYMKYEIQLQSTNIMSRNKKFMKYNFLCNNLAELLRKEGVEEHSLHSSNQPCLTLTPTLFHSILLGLTQLYPISNLTQPQIIWLSSIPYTFGVTQLQKDEAMSTQCFHKKYG